MPTPESTDDVFRIKSAMVVFALERSLGQLVEAKHLGDPNVLNSSPFQQIEQRSNVIANDASSKATRPEERVRAVVACSYIEEILNLALEVTRDATELAEVKRLAQLATHFELFAIRNAIAHPNRPFPSCYWYRAAAIASDPAIEKLQFNDVRMALQAAEVGQLIAPPEDWMRQISSAIANTLPREFQHELTGLLGRQKQARDLEEYLKSGKYKLLAIVAPGGVGKTALALDVLRKCSLDPTNASWCRAIVFISLKQTSLTAEGIVEHSAAQTLEELTEEIHSSLGLLFPEIEAERLSGFYSALGETKILLCIDNLETLLRDKPDSFINLFEEFPPEWTVIVTSRVTIDGARTLTLGALSDESARGLAFKYLSTKGIGPLDTQAVDRICKDSKNNPLAIRLTVDRYANGHPLLQAGASVQADIVAFSYRNLVETLSADANRIMECLFVCGKLNRTEIVDYMALNPDSAAQAIRELMSTSLAIRSEEAEEEVIELSPSVRDLLRENPRDLSLREKVRRLINERTYSIRQHQSIQRHQRVSKFSENYIGEDVPTSLNSRLVKAISLVRSENVSHSQYVTMIRGLRRDSSSSGRFPVYSVTLGRLYQKTGDLVSAEEEFRKAVKCSSDNPMARIILGEYLLRDQRGADALDIFKSLETDGWAALEKSDELTALRVWFGLFKALLEADQLEELERYAVQQFGSQSLGYLARIASATGLIKSVSALHGRDNEKTINIYLAAAQKLTEKPDTPIRRIVNFWTRALRYLCKECAHLLDMGGLEERHAEKLCKVLSTVEKHFWEAYDNAGTYIRPVELVQQIRTLRHARNPFLAEQWAEYCGESRAQEAGDENLKLQGLNICHVVHIPYTEDVASFVIAETAENKSIFVPRVCCKDLDWMKWAKLRIGSPLGFVWLEEPRKAGGYPVAKEVVLP
ncbi:MAG TPA: hypothetical protein VG796_18295 [Verrucomicrobiales bacterium]|nr:hypothetical protein [Verrucomicrobiales bacterium]